MSVNWLLVLLIGLAFVLVRLAVTGRYAQVYGAMTSIPLTPAQAQAQTAAQQSNGSNPFSQFNFSGFNRIG